MEEEEARIGKKKFNHLFSRLSVDQPFKHPRRDETLTLSGDLPLRPARCPAATIAS